MNSVFSIKPFIFALIICCQYYQNEENKSEHIFKEHNATITLSSRINRLLTECEAVPSTNPLSSYRQKEKEFNAKSQNEELMVYINDIANLENDIEENMNNNHNMIEDSDDDEIEIEEEGHSSNCQTYSKRGGLTGDHEKNPKYFLGINQKKMKKYMTNRNMQSGFVGPTAFGLGYIIRQGMNPSDIYAADYMTNYWLTGSALIQIIHLVFNVFFKTRKVNI
ncbi:Plasmodium exported protein, unknown function [Plasmodium vinckei lentum]|uniref:Fam-b protein n=1 Tax=Plasmodium vinckei lentum TaxID=138297 RepID=A0A6V7RZ75_PLAVN|nr:Plasmodium exported protein, unknown function [Plasmodium vinckei lentum]